MTTQSNDDKDSELNTTQPELSRRGFLGATSTPALLALTGVSTAATATALLPNAAQAEVVTPTGNNSRYARARRVRTKIATDRYLDARENGPQPTNDDDLRYDDYRGSFHKCLPQNEFGEVDTVAYEALRNALKSGAPDDYDAVPLSVDSDRRLENPQGGLTFNLTGIDPHAPRMRPAPAFASAETAAEMGEVYWHARLRDVAFVDYAASDIVGSALADLNNNFVATVGPTQSGQVTAATLFRGATSGDLAGPYVSQFLLKDVRFGQALIQQRYATPDSTSFMTHPSEWIAIQRGAAPTRSISYLSEPRYIYSARALGEYVHVDVLSQAYLFAALIGLGMGALGVETYTGNPSQQGFTSLGGPDFLDTVWHVGNMSLRAAWFQKWAAHRRLRPEVYSGRVHFTLSGDRAYDVHPDILNADVVTHLLRENGSALLPLAYPEGSPTHPAYPAGHATVAGACCTVLKAFLDEDFIVPAPVQASADGTSLLPYVGGDLRIGDEINKLASNISLGRDLAGVHYRSDGIDGLLVGEQVALQHLKDQTQTYNEDFEGFALTRFDGSQVLVAEGNVYEL